MPLSFGNGVVIQVVPPDKPTVRIAPPSPAALALVPVQGPAGPQGPPGDSSSALAYTTSVTNQSLVQMIHNLPFNPAGILCLDTNTPALTVEYATVSHPGTGITELTFGFPFTGSIFLS